MRFLIGAAAEFFSDQFCEKKQDQRHFSPYGLMFKISVHTDGFFPTTENSNTKCQNQVNKCSIRKIIYLHVNTSEVNSPHISNKEQNPNFYLHF